MKTIQTIIITLLLTFLAVVTPIHAEETLLTHYYPQTFYITAVDETENVLYLSTFSGVEYAVAALVEDWLPGDLVAAIMYDGATPDDITDDLIYAMRYTGYIW